MIVTKLSDPDNYNNIRIKCNICGKFASILKVRIFADICESCRETGRDKDIN